MRTGRDLGDVFVEPQPISNPRGWSEAGLHLGGRHLSPSSWDSQGLVLGSSSAAAEASGKCKFLTLLETYLSKPGR